MNKNVAVFVYGRALKHIGWRSLLLQLVVLSFGVFSLHVGANIVPTSEPYPKTINFRNIMQNQDIALGEVEAITQDYQGFIWLGGRNALLRYDGYEFLKVNAAKNLQDLTQTSPASQVLELIEDSQHTLWVATRSGLYQYDRTRELLLPFINSEGAPFFRETIYALAESPKGELLVGTGNGFWIIDTKSLAATRMYHQPGDPQSLPGSVVGGVLVDAQGDVWLGIEEGLVRIDWATK